MNNVDEDLLLQNIQRIADALERSAPPPSAPQDFEQATAFVWHCEPDGFRAVFDTQSIELNLLVGVERACNTLLENSLRFARGLPANNALLWGARGMGKSSLVKAVHAEINRQGHPLKLVELQREDLPSISRVLEHLKYASHSFILFCDDLSFTNDDQHYKALKAVLDGGVEGRPDNVLFYATSNRRHLMPRDMIENERSSAINPGEAGEEKISLSDRFGLWLGFHSCSQEEFFAMVRGYVHAYNIPITEGELEHEAREWQAARGARSGRVAWQFLLELAGRYGMKIV